MNYKKEIERINEILPYPKRGGYLTKIWKQTKYIKAIAWN